MISGCFPIFARGHFCKRSITPILGLLGRGRPQAVNCQLSTVNCQLSTVNCQLSTVVYFFGSITWISTLATPLLIIPSTLAAPADKSISRSPT
ncbi:MAG: hypothetical protein JGK08_25675 [Microcoleus sp. PH2017_04_SCI_O_A]|nr:hypothetical protein [Microcoleus sp. PH2017_04_SCI_O_A]